MFCHNDLQEGNILLPSDENISKMLNSNKAQQFEDHIVFIDFEFCAYNYRGFDIGNHFCERMFDYSNQDWPHYYTYPDQYPDEEQKRRFIIEYLSQAKELNSSDKVDSVEQVVKEADFYALASHLIWTLWSIINSRTSKISFGYLV